MIMGKSTIGTIAPMLGVPFVHAEFCWSLAQMIQYSNEYICKHGEIIHLVKPTLTYHAAARNDIVRNMLGDWILMLDCDHSFAPDMLARLLYLSNSFKVAGVDVDVLSAIYFYRMPPHGPLLYHWNDKHTGFVQLVNWDEHARIMEIDSAGGGSLFIRRSVIERMYNELKEEPFSIIPPFSEDHSFFVRLEKLGIKAWAAPGIQSHHLLTKPLGVDDYVDRMDEIATPTQKQGYDLSLRPI